MISRMAQQSKYRTSMAILAGVFGLAVSACGSSSRTATPPSTTPSNIGSPTSVASAKGTANVAYAGSLLYLQEKVIGPAFRAKTKYKYVGRGAGSLALSQEILSKEITPNVFLSVGGKPIQALEPKFTSWYVQVAASPIVIAYSQSSRFAPELAAIAAGSRPLADLVTLLATPGFRLGRSDPNVDPQGQAFIEMLQLVKAKLALPAGTIEKILGGSASSANSSEIFDETALEPRLEAGQLDAASAYLSQAIQLHLPYIDLGPSLDLGDPALVSTYATASLPLSNGKVVHGGPLVVDATVIGTTDSSAAAAFVAYLLSPAGLQALSQNGYRLLHPQVFGDHSAVPQDVAGELGS
jgi:molybdate/tungstate transport system substrate-binding protein